MVSLAGYWKIPGYQPPATPPEGERLTVQAAADQLGVAPSTLPRWIGDGFIGGEQVTPGAPPGYVSMLEAMRRVGCQSKTPMPEDYGVRRQTFQKPQPRWEQSSVPEGCSPRRLTGAQLLSVTGVKLRQRGTSTLPCTLAFNRTEGGRPPAVTLASFPGSERRIKGEILHELKFLNPTA